MSRHPAIITSNLESEFRRVTTRPSSSITINERNLPQDIPPHVVKAMRRSAQVGNVDRVNQFRYNPFLQTTNLDIPSDIRIRHQYMRYFVKTDPLVGAAIELHAEFPLSEFRVEHEDSAIQEFLQDMVEETDLVDHVLMCAQEYWTVGEFFSFGFLDDLTTPSCWTGFLLLDPDKVMVQTSPWLRGPKKEQVSLVVDAVTQKVIDNGPTHPTTGEIYRMLPIDIITAGKARRPLMLSPLQVSHVKRGSPFALRGESIIERIFTLLMYKSKLREACYAIADRHLIPTEIFKVGEPGDPADNEELQALQDQVQATFYDRQRALIWHHALQYEVHGADGKALPIWQEMDQLDSEILAGLLLNKSLIMGDSGTFASDVVRYDILINRYLIFRKRMEKWLLRQVFAPIMKIHEMYVPEYKVKSLQYRQMCDKGRPLNLPTIKWEKQNLRDDASKIELLLKLASQQLIPYSSIYPLLNMDPHTVQEKVDKELEETLVRRKQLAERLAKKGIRLPPIGGQGEEGALPNASFDLGGGGGGLMDAELPSAPGGLEGNITPEGSLPGGGVNPGAGIIPGTEGGATEALAGEFAGAPTESKLPIGVPTG